MYRFKTVTTTEKVRQKSDYPVQW